MVGSAGSAYSTRELSRKTWPDFERLFSQGGGWDFCFCMHFHRLRSLPKSEFRTRAEQGVRNRRETKAKAADASKRSCRDPCSHQESTVSRFASSARATRSVTRESGQATTQPEPRRSMVVGQRDGR